jgi:hypothetical protein
MKEKRDYTPFFLLEATERERERRRRRSSVSEL